MTDLGKKHYSHWVSIVSLLLILTACQELSNFRNDSNSGETNRANTSDSVVSSNPKTVNAGPVDTSEPAEVFESNVNRRITNNSFGIYKYFFASFQNSDHNPSVGHQPAIGGGELMYIWGGLPYPRNASYDPKLNIWTSLPHSGLEKESRVNHSLAFGDGFLFVWGGFDGVYHLNDGAFYDINRKTWTITSTEGAPSARSGASTVFTGKVFYIGSNDYNSDSFLFNPKANTWFKTSAVNAPRVSNNSPIHWTGTEILVMNNECSKTWHFYNPETDIWRSRDVIVNGKYNCGEKVWTFGEGLYATWGSAYWSSGRTFYGGSIVDINTMQSTEIKNEGSPEPRVNSSIAIVKNVIFIYGGSSSEKHTGLLNGGLYDMATKLWLKLDIDLGRREYSSTVLLSKNIILHSCGVGSGYASAGVCEATYNTSNKNTAIFQFRD